MAKTQPVEALVVIDIGNTRVDLAIFDEDGLHDVCHIDTDAPDTWRESIEKTWTACNTAKTREVVIASVVPERTHEMTTLIADICHQDALVVREDLPLPIDLQVDNPDAIGVDRACSAAAAYDRIQGPCAVASFGTAITVDCISADGKMLGGAILPGLDLSFEALHRGTAQLPQVKVTRPKGPFGKNTEDAIVMGVTYGAIGALREIVERFAVELHEWPHLVITGGNAAVIHELSDFVDAVVPNLCLMGIALAHQKAAGQK